MLPPSPAVRGDHRGATTPDRGRFFWAEVVLPQFPLDLGWGNRPPGGACSLGGSRDRSPHRLPFPAREGAGG